MKRSTERILTTHTGSLPRPPDLAATLEALDAGTTPDPAVFDARVQRAVTEWVDSLVDLAGQLGRTITQLAAEIEQKAAELEAAADELLGDLVDLLNHLSAHAGSRQALRRTVRDLAVNEALGVLRSLGIYQGLPRELRVAARELVRDAVGAARLRVPLR